jgi:hypothetical protein
MNKTYITLIIIICNFLATAQTIPFQDTKGSLEISNSGQANYTIPIALPPSLKNVAPKIDLVYSSGARGGIAGQGWNISSISSISRMATRYDIDGFRDGVDFDDNDKLALDGQRLLIKTGTYWAAGSTYQTEYKSNTKIELRMENATGYGPQTYFVVTSPDGSQTWYGSTGNGVFQNATSPNAWFIVRFMDTYGNYITYNYTTVTYAGVSNQYIDNIQFSGNEWNGLPQLNKIQFNYANAARVEKDFIKGEAFYASKILNNVQVFTKDNSNVDVLFRRYQLTHSTDDLGYQRVAQMQEYNGVGEASNPVVFGYGATSNTAIFNTRGQAQGPASQELSGDFNGDGTIDIVSGNNIYLDSFNPGGLIVGLPFNYEINSVFVGNTLGENKMIQKNTLFKISNEMGNIKVDSYKLNQNNTQMIFNYTKIIETLPYIVYEEEAGGTREDFFYDNATNKYYLGDFNGDGISDLFYIKKNKFIIPEHLPYTSGSVTSEPYLVGIIDLNPNIINQINTQNNYIYSDEQGIYNIFRNIRKIEILDFNGDGKDDIMLDKNDNSYIIINFKQLTVAPWVELEIIGQGVLNTTMPKFFGDYNGDGKVDIMIPHAVGSYNWSIWYANPKPWGGPLFDYALATGPMYRPYWNNYMEGFSNVFEDFKSYYQMDVNKDGKTDLVEIKTSRYNNYPYGFDNDFEIRAYTNNIERGTGFNETWYSGIYSSPTPDVQKTFVGNYKLNTQADIIMWDSQCCGHNSNVSTFRFQRDMSTDNRLVSVAESNNNIVQNIAYKPLIPTVFYGQVPIEVNYPNLVTEKIVNNFFVSKLTAITNGVSKYQYFRYEAMYSNFNYGTIGFGKTTSMLRPIFRTVT